MQSTFAWKFGKGAKGGPQVRFRFAEAIGRTSDGMTFTHPSCCLVSMRQGENSPDLGPNLLQVRAPLASQGDEVRITLPNGFLPEQGVSAAAGRLNEGPKHASNETRIVGVQRPARADFIGKRVEPFRWRCSCQATILL